MANPEDRIVIDAAEFEEAQRDPKVRGFLREAAEYGEQVITEGRDAAAHLARTSLGASSEALEDWKARGLIETKPLPANSVRPAEG